MTKELLDIHCAHGKPVTSRCRQCEHDIFMGKGTGFTRPQPEQAPSKKWDWTLLREHWDKGRGWMRSHTEALFNETARLQRELDAARREADTSAKVAGKALTELHDKCSAHEPKSEHGVRIPDMPAPACGSLVGEQPNHDRHGAIAPHGAIAAAFKMGRESAITDPPPPVEPDQQAMDRIFDSWFDSLSEPPQNYHQIFTAGYAAGLLRASQPPDPGLSSAATQAARDVLAERWRQRSVEAWTAAHDDQYEDGSIAVAAACYALEHPGWRGFTHSWPWADAWWKPKDRRRNLVKAGALILAEIERLDRASQTKGEG